MRSCARWPIATGSAGISEAVKVALIRDPAFFDEIEAARGAAGAPRPGGDGAGSSAAPRRCISRTSPPAAIRSSSGSSRPLDFGHWAAHKLEQLTDHRLRHGEAVAIGIALDTTYAYLRGLPAPSATGGGSSTLLIALAPRPSRAGTGARASTIPTTARSVLRGLEEFREHLGGELTIMLLRGIGQPFDVHEIDPDVMIRSIGVLTPLEAGRAAAHRGAPSTGRGVAENRHEATASPRSRR